MEKDIGRFVRWAAPITLDVAKMPLDATRRLVGTLLPGAQNENLVEFNCEDEPSREILDLRTKSF